MPPYGVNIKGYKTSEQQEASMHSFSTIQCYGDARRVLREDVGVAVAAVILVQYHFTAPPWCGASCSDNISLSHAARAIHV